MSADKEIFKVPPCEIERLEQIGFLTAMTLTLLGNYSQTGHFGGPLAYTPYNVALHLAGPDAGGLRYDFRRPKHPFADRFMVAGGHNVPTAYALWMIISESMARRYDRTRDSRYYVDPKLAILAIDALGFRRGHGALATLLSDHGLGNSPLFAQASMRGIRSLAGHSETTDLTNDVNGGPSGIGIGTSAGKAAFWDFVGAPPSLKVMALEGEFALTSGHAQELKTQAVAQQVGKRLRILLSNNNAGIDDTLHGGVVSSNMNAYSIKEQWASYNWNVFTMNDGNNYEEILSTLQAMEHWDPSDRRPMMAIGNTIKGWWPEAINGMIPGYGRQVISHSSHAYDMKINAPYFVALAQTFETRFDVVFSGISNGEIDEYRELLIQFKTNIDVVMSVLDKDGLGDWLADRIVAIANTVPANLPLRFKPTKSDPFCDQRLRVSQLPVQPVQVKLFDQNDRKHKTIDVCLFKPPGEAAGTRRAISEVIKWINHVTDNRFITIAADLSGSINVESGSLTGHYDPVKNPSGTRFKAAIQEACNTLTAIGLISQTTSSDPNIHEGVWALSGSYGAFTPLMYLPARVWSQQNQDSPFRTGVLNILAGHSGPETAADARTHFGIFAPQVWRLFPRGQVICLNFWDYNDVAPGYFAAAEIAARKKEVGIIVIEVARPDFPVVDRNLLTDTDLKAASKGFYVLRDFTPGKPRSGYVIAQGSSSTFNSLQVLPALEEAGINVKLISAISEELFDHQPASYRNSVLPAEAYNDLMIISTGTQRLWPIRDIGPLAREYSLTSDWHDRWLTGGSEADVVAEAHLDTKSILEGIKRFAADRSSRLGRQKKMLAALE